MEATMVIVTRLCLVVILANVAYSEMMEVMQGKEVVIECPGTGASGAAEFWIHPSGRQMPVPSLGYTYTTNETSLTIKEAEQGDAGRFMCVGRDGQRLTYGSVDVIVKSSEPPYWQRHGTNLIMSLVAAVSFLVLATGIFLVHQYRYEKRHKLDGRMNGASHDSYKRGHNNPALDIEAETHM